MLRTKQPGSTTESMDEHTTNMFEFNLYSARLRNYIRNEIQLANRCQRLSVFSTTNTPLVLQTRPDI